VAKRIGLLPCLIIYLIILIGCTTGGNNSHGTKEPNLNQDISGVWLGSFAAKSYPKGIFTIGIITADGQARFIGENTQFVVGPDGALVVDANTFTLRLSPDQLPLPEDDLEHWIQNDAYGSAIRFISTLFGFVATRQSIFDVGYRYDDNEETGSVPFLFYNTTFDPPADSHVRPDVNNIQGTWKIKESPAAGQSITLTIEPNLATTMATSISGSDTLNNTFTGSVSIHFNPATEKKAHNIYDVNLTMNEGTAGEISLAGLAAYVLNVDTGGITLGKTLAIGATNTDKDHPVSLSGLADPVP
jgi:hypothetical protein